MKTLRLYNSIGSLALPVVALLFWGCGKGPQDVEWIEGNKNSDRHGPQLAKASRVANGIVYADGSPTFFLGFMGGAPNVANEFDFMSSTPQYDHFNLYVASVGGPVSYWDPGPPNLDGQYPGTPPDMGYGPPAEGTADQGGNGYWDTYPWWSYAQELRRQSTSMSYPYIMIGYPSAHCFEKPDTTIYTYFTLPGGPNNIIGWYTTDEPDYANSIHWTDWFMNYQLTHGGENTIWGPVVYGERYYYSQTPNFGLSHQGPRLAVSGHQLLMVDCYDLHHLPDVVHKASVDADGTGRSLICWLGLHQYNNMKYIEYSFWTAVVHGAKGIVWYNQDMTLMDRLALASPDIGNPYDGNGIPLEQGGTGPSKFQNSIGERLSNLVGSFISLGIRDAILNHTTNTADFEPLPDPNETFMYGTGGQRRMQYGPSGPYYPLNGYSLPEENVYWDSALSQDLNARIFEVLNGPGGASAWYVVIVNDNPWGDGSGEVQPQFIPGAGGYARFRINNIPGDQYTVRMIDGNILNHFSLTMGSNSCEITTYLGGYGYRIFEIAPIDAGY